MKVYLRVKPLDSQEVEAGESKGYLEIRDLKTVLLQPPETSLAFKRHQSTNPVTVKAIERFTFSRALVRKQTKEKCSRKHLWML